MPEFGDILKYREDEAWQFMFLRTNERGLIVLVVEVDPGDDLWVEGETIITVGINELVPE